jgi:hypothetical protein
MFMTTQKRVILLLKASKMISFKPEEAYLTSLTRRMILILFLGKVVQISTLARRTIISQR